MPALHEARYYERRPAREVVCTLCPHECHIREGGRGACGVRFNAAGTLYTVAYERAVSRRIEPIEKKPLYHFFPGSRAYSIATVGCNLRCSFCQNWQISQWPKDALPKRLAARDSPGDALGFGASSLAALEDLAARVLGAPATPRAIVDAAVASRCRSIAYTYTEPTVFYELALDTARLARERGLKNVFVTNGFTSDAPLRELSTVLDAANVDLKFFRDESYVRISRARLSPILDAIRRYRELGVWVEATTLVIPGINDSDDELHGIARFLASVGEDLPWHVSGFYPAWRMKDRDPTPIETLHRAAAIGRAVGLRYVYVGNLPDREGSTTRCHACSAPLIVRSAMTVVENRVRGGCCPSCGALVGGVAMSPPDA